MTTSPPAGYSSSVSFLLSQIGAQSAALFARRLAPLGISPRTFGVLSNLASAEGQSQQRLADSLGIHRNNMVGLVDEMEAAGWVRRHRSDVDRRAFELHLTRSGMSLVAKASKLVPELDDAISQGLSPAERSTILRLLGKIAVSLDLAPGVHPHLRGSAG